MNYKNAFRVMFALVMLSFSIQAQTYISEDFETVSSGLPTGWVSVGPGTVAVRTSNGHNGYHSLRFSGAVSNVVALPELSVPINTTQVTLWTKADGNYTGCGSFQVGYLTNVNDETSFVALENVSYSDYITYGELTVPMTQAPAGARIAFRHTPNYIYYYWYCDDVTVEALPSCMPVTNLTAIPGYNAVMLSWSDTVSGHSYTVLNMTTGDTLATALTAQSYVVQNLAHSTAYTFGVVANCSATEVSPVTTINTQTVCMPSTIPFVEDLEGGVMPPCWTQNGAWTWRVGTGDHEPATGAHSGSHNFLITSDSYDGTAKLITPQLDLTNVGPSVHLSFWHLQRSWVGDNDGLKVYYRTSELSSWVLLASYTDAIENWTEENLALPNITADYQIAFDFQAGWGKGVAIDDIRIEAPASCSHVMNLTATPASNSVLLEWTDTQNTGATYTVYNANSGNVLATNCSGNSYVVTGLTPGTNYQFSVVANCSATESSTPTTVSVQTSCGIRTIPFHEDFNGLVSGIPACWDNSEGTTSINSWKWKHDTTGYSGTGLKFNSYVNEDGNTNVLSTPSVTISENAILSFWCKNPDGGDLSVFISVDTNSTRDTLITNLTSINDWMQVGLPLDSAAYTGHNVTIYFQGTSNYGSDDAYIYLDEVSITAMVPHCSSVDQLLVESVSTTSVSLSWMSNAVSYTVMNNNVQVATGITDTHYTLTGLTPATHYTFSVIAHCLDSVSSDAVSVDAFTDCLAFELPYVESFEENGYYNCWTVYSDALETGPMELATFAESGTYVFAFESSANPPQYLVSPELTGTDNGLRLSFSYMSFSASSSDSVVVGYSTTTNDIDAFVWSTRITGIPTYFYDRFDEDVMVSGIKYVAIKSFANASYSLYIDSLVIEALPSCMPVTNLAFGNSTATSVTLFWTDVVNDGATYTIYNMADTSVVATNVTETHYTINGLYPSATITYAVVANCSEEDASTPVLIDAMTACEAFELPYTEDFEADGNYNCWTVHATSAYTDRMDMFVYAESGIGFFAFANSPNPPQYLISPELTGTGAGVQFEFGYRAMSSFFAESFAVGYSTTTNDISAFVWSTEVTDITNEVYNRYVEQMEVVGVKYVAIKYTAFDKSSLLIDSLVISKIADICMPVTDLSVEDISATSVTLSWVNSDNEDASYTVLYLSGDDMIVDTTGLVETIYTVQGLTPSTQYSFLIRTDCEDTAVYSNPVIVVTQSQQSVSSFDGTSSWNLYPNPANTVVTVDAKDMRRVTIYDATGREVLRRNVNNDSESFDVSSLENGVYFFRIETADYMSVRKCIVNH
ncbi:MAG: choice-of-anchor J domain-containing protein [Bacteroidales bacterium]|nr:choice-of-anchor J domain-containing protein [Bacteroidales bacterium]